MSLRVAVVILNYNGEKFLERFLPGVLRSLPATDAERMQVIVADNGSTDGSLALLQQNFPQVSVRVLQTNEGYAGGYNQALRGLEADYYVLLNSDVEVPPGWIEPVIRFMDSRPDVAACQPKILSYAEKDSFEYAGAGGGYIDRYGYPFCRGRIFGTLEKDKGQYDDTREIFWASGACFFVRSAAFHACGGFDADFFAHMEEIDLCWRMKRLGHRIYCCPQSTVYHVGGGTLSKESPQKTYLNFRNNLLMLKKNLPADRYRQVLWTRRFLDLVAAGKFLASFQAGNFAAVLKAHNFMRHYKSDPGIPAAPLAGVYDGSIVWDYYVKGIRKFSGLNSFPPAG